MSDKRLTKLTPRALEYACIDDWRAKHCEQQWGWLQFATMGQSARVNSVWPLEWLGDGHTPETVIEWCERWAALRGIDCAFKLADGAVSPANLAEVLAARGYAPSGETLVMLRQLDALAAPQREIAWADKASEDFYTVLRASSPREEDYAERSDIVRRMSNASTFPVAHIDRAPVAIGLGRHSGPIAGLYLMRTAPEARRRGLARDLVRTLCAWARYNGAGAAFLQVEEANGAAVALYSSEGFETSYRYRYWRRN